MRFGFEAGLQVETDKPFDVGYRSGLCGMTFFECPYDHKNAEGLRLRHEWLNGYLAALAEKKVTFPF